MKPYLDDGDVTVYLADCVDAMRAMTAESVDAIVCDPPYGLEFMGKEWDSFKPNARSGSRADGGASFGSGIRYQEAGTAAQHAFQSWCEAWALEALRVAKPGAHLAAFGGTRTYHRLACGIEDAGWELRDSLAWMYGSGFPKSLDVSKAIDKAAGVEREVVGTRKGGAAMNVNGDNPRPWHERQAERGGEYDVTAPATPDAAAWAGWGTALKPGYEPIVLARKPLRGTVAGNVLAYGTGALNIDACRIDGTKAQRGERRTALGRMNDDGWQPSAVQADDASGRWPANVVLDEAAAAMLDEQTGDRPTGALDRSKITAENAIYGKRPRGLEGKYEPSTGGASRFFYTAKADAEERQAPDGTRNTHPTVKPTDLMRWLVRLVTPPGGVVLDPFAGSGSTGVACRAEQVRCILVEREAEYAAIIASRLAQQSLFSA